MSPLSAPVHERETAATGTPAANVPRPFPRTGAALGPIEGAKRAGQDRLDRDIGMDRFRLGAPSAGVATATPTSTTRVFVVPMGHLDRALKRTLDVLSAGLALAMLAIPLTIIALLVKATSRGPVFYRQIRIGLDGKPFTILKFRSMYPDAEHATGPVWAQPNDPRATPFGRHLRRLNLDELPQLWNVLRGDMSLVGPRPERPHFVSQFKHRIPRYMLRHHAPPGITGWAQVHGWRGNTSLEKRIEHDLDYIGNWSLALDVKIMWLTVRTAFFHDRAY